MKRPALLVGLPVVALVLAACGTGSGTRVFVPPSTTSSVPTTLVPTAQEASQEATRGCLATLSVSDVISEAADANSMAPLQNRDTGPSSSWTYLTDMADLASIPKYRQLSSDVSAFVRGEKASEASGNLNTVENALTAVVGDCGALGYATSPAPPPSTTTAPPATVPPTTQQSTGGPTVATCVTAITGHYNPAWNPPVELGDLSTLQLIAYACGSQNDLGSAMADVGGSYPPQGDILTMVQDVCPDNPSAPLCING